MAATSLESPSPSPSPSSDKRFWTTLNARIHSLAPSSTSPILTLTRNNKNVDDDDRSRSNRLKEDSLLLMRGFDSVAHTLSLLSNNLDNALQGARELGHAPTLIDIFQTKIDEEEKDSGKEKQKEQESSKQGIKRKLDDHHIDSFSQENGVVEVDTQTGNGQKKHDRHIKKAKNLAVSMATTAASLARELKSIKSDLCFMQDSCSLLEEENRRLRDGFAKGIRPEEDDLVRLQLEALLGDKSRLANENANLVRENQCLHQLVEYHQLASQDLQESYEHVIQGMQLDFSTIAEEDDDGDFSSNREEELNHKHQETIFSSSLNRGEE